MPDQSVQLDSILCAAAELATSEERADYLRRQCGGDEGLLQRAEKLLDAHLRAGSFLASPVFDFAATVEQSPLSESPGTVIGPYKLLQQIGEGGMGVVFMAEQTLPIRRMVALKIIKPGMDSRQVIARFEAERQALAMMDHPNIAKVLDAGATSTGRPYFVMELVKGVPITRYCDDHQLTLRQRLELFLPVCQAIQHAHQKGIIHRDLKPTNVLVTEYDSHPVPKVIDFGVAKATAQKLTERTMFTEFGQVIGTVEYMSPEQAKFNQLDIDTRSDVYSLGVLAYELLTGSTPFDKSRLRTAAFDEVLRIIREEEPAKPSTRLGESESLPAIAANRHTEPARLGREIRGELDWIVMKCLEKDRNRRYETANGLSRDIERYLADEPVQACPPSVSYRLKKLVRRNKIAAGFILLIAMAAAALAVSNVQTRRSEQRAITENAKAQAINDLLQTLLASSNPEAVTGKDYTVRQLLDDFSAQLGNEIPDQPEVEAEIRATIGRAYWRLGLTNKAEPHLKRALDLRRTIYGPDHVKVADSLVDHAWNLAQQSQHEKAVKSAHEAVRIYTVNGTTGSPVLQASWGLQRFLTSLGEYDQARVAAMKALSMANESGEDYPEVANILHTMADAEIQDRQYDAAEKHARESVAIHRRLHGADHTETAWGLQTLGSALYEQKKYDEAEQVMREALAIFNKRYDSDHLYVIRTLGSLRGVLIAKNDQVGLDQLAKPLTGLSASSKVTMFEALLKLNEIHSGQKKWEKAADDLDEACNWCDLADEEQFRTLQETTRHLFMLCIYSGEGGLGIAETIARRFIVICKQANGEDHDDVRQWGWNLSMALERQGKFAESEPLSLKLARKELEKSPNDPDANWVLANILIDAREPKIRDIAEGLKLAKRATELDPKGSTAHYILALAHYRLGQWQLAIDAEQQALNLDSAGSDDWLLMAMAHWQLGRKEEGRRWYDKAVARRLEKKPQYPDFLSLYPEATKLLGIAKLQTEKASDSDTEPASPTP